MKVAVTSGGRELTSRFDTRFGRAAYFIVYELDGGHWSWHDNVQNYEAAQGAGIQAADTVRRLGATALVTGHVGPKAFKVLAASGIKIYTTAAQTVQEALDAYKSGALSPQTAADVEGHWV